MQMGIIMNTAIMDQILEITRECGEIILSAKQIESSVTEKSGPANFVTEYDKKVQKVLFQKLKEVIPTAQFIGEEEENHGSIGAGYTFIIDPIDGTTNFIKEYKWSSISIGLLKDGKPYMGVVYNPYLKELFYAEKGKGAFVNGKPIHASSHPIAEGIVLFGTAPYYPELTDKTFETIRKFYDVALDIRRSGSAALDLCYVASGRAEIFFELILQPWDYTAGSLIVSEAGGIVTTLEQTEIVYHMPVSLIAGGREAYHDIFRIYP